MLYSIALCRKCGQPGALKEGSKTFKCVYCGLINQSSKSVRIFEHVESKDVPSVIAKLKEVRAKENSQIKRD